MTDSNLQTNAQAPQCFYCGEGIDSAAEITRGAFHVAHRACVHANLVRLFKARYPERPTQLALNMSRLPREMRESGVTAEEVWG